MTMLTLAATFLILAGFLLLFIAVFLELLRSLKKDETRVEKHGGAVVMIGPIPIILASDTKTAKILLLLAIMLTAVLILLMILAHTLYG